MKTIRFFSTLLFVFLFSQTTTNAQNCTFSSSFVRISKHCQAIPGNEALSVTAHNWSAVSSFEIELCVTGDEDWQVANIVPFGPTEEIQYNPQNNSLILRGGSCESPIGPFPYGSVVQLAAILVQPDGNPAPGSCLEVSLCENGINETVYCDPSSGGIYAFPIQSCPGGICISSGVSDAAGAITTVAGNGIIGFDINESLGGTTTTTDIDGKYSFPNLAGNDFDEIEITPDPNSLSPNLDGLTTFDMVLIRKHILGEITLDCFQQVAADINGDGAISTLDMVLLKSSILELAPKENAGKWVIIPADANWDCATDLHGYPISVNHDLCTLPTPIDFVAVKIGDVNGSATMKASALDPPTPETNTLSIFPQPFTD
ncbi:MAG: dockerin type I repeat-containing protein, partial [Bacteroidota bacterium]